MSDFSWPCAECVDGRHDDCSGGLCGCIAAHVGDERIMANFKRIKRQLHPERESWTRGGWASKRDGSTDDA